MNGEALCPGLSKSCFPGFLRVHAHAVGGLMPPFVEFERKPEQIWSVVGEWLASRRAWRNRGSWSILCLPQKSLLRADGWRTSLKMTHGLNDDPDGPCVAVIMEVRSLAQS